MICHVSASISHVQDVAKEVEELDSHAMSKATGPFRPLKGSKTFKSHVQPLRLEPFLG